jgi:hypothetical protein
MEKVRIARTVFVIWEQNSLLLWQRSEDESKLAGFWELPEPEHLSEPIETTEIGGFRHSITNHEYNFTVLVWKGYGVFPGCKNVVKAEWIACNRLENMALSTTARKAISVARTSHDLGRVE